MNRKRFRPLVGPLALALTLAWILVHVGSGYAATVAFRTRADTDVLTFALDGDPAGATVGRTGGTQVSVRLAGGERLEAPRDVAGSRLVEAVRPADGGAVVTLKTNAFGYIFTPVPGENALQVQFFRDPLGARWQDPAAQPPAPAADAPGPAPRPDTPQPTAAGDAPATATAQADAPEQAEEAASAVPEPEGNLTLDRPSAPASSLFSVPYAVRVPVTDTENALQVGPSELGTVDVESGTARYKAVNTISEPDAPEEVLPATDTEVAPPSGEPEDGVSALDRDGLPPPTGPGGFVQRVTAGFAEPPTQAPAAMESAAGEAPQAEAAAPPSSSLAAEAEQAMREARAAYDGQESAPGESVAAANETAETAETGVRVEDEAVQTAVDTIEAGEAAVAEDVAERGLSPEEAKMVEGLELELIKAQSQIASGKLAEAKAALEGILARPGVPPDLRLEAMYSLGGVLMTLYKDTPVEHFDEITGLYKEAINADTDSPNIPQALMNLGLINLRVGNLPEARAYFELLDSQYPDNDNVPSIEYYWGEYYFRQGDWQEAADRFQGFIERYPEQERLARQAAFRLAESLKNLELYEQAYQIVDYIDKRWPQVFESSPGFLKLAGDVEYNLELFDKAKEHYWTYFNINPKADQADVVLARIGDIFLRSDDLPAAKTIYERTVEQYPDLEGGLVAKMRLAEEGIYDEPTMVEMVSVFDRPFTLRPKQVYTEIVDEHPESPLAPLALLKLGMWHFFQKEYPEALAAAQRLLDEYPRSTLTERARELGDRAFALAVPQLIEQEDYQTVVDYWEKYDFISESEGEESSATRIGVARSYAALDEYGKALELLKPFLGEEQVPQYSELALAVGLDVYLKQRAWNRINDLSGLVENNWELSDRARRLLMHANAVALENLGENQKSARLWAQLGADEDVEDFIRADALYFMAKEAMKHDDLRRVFVYAQEALSLLLSSKGDSEKIKDCLLMSIHATERSGRYRQALKWALEYDKYVPPEDPEWAAQRYKLAELYRKSGFPEEWQRVMENLRDDRPGTLYGRLAATALETEQLEQRASEYAPIPN